MATIITLPNIVGLDKELCVPEGNQRLWNYFSVEGYSVKHSKIFEPHLFMPTNRSNLPYQKMVDRYQFLTSDGVKPKCEPLCPEGWYFDCETETCKEYSSYVYSILTASYTLTSWWHEWTDYVGMKYGTYVSTWNSTTYSNVTQGPMRLSNNQVIYKGKPIGLGVTDNLIETYTHTESFTRDPYNLENSFDIYTDGSIYAMQGYILPISPTDENYLGTWALGFEIDTKHEFTIQVYGVK